MKSSRSPIHPFLFVGLVGVLGILLWMNLGDSGDDPSIPVLVDLQATIYVTVLAVDAELEATGSLPANLESIGMDEEGVTYFPEQGGFTLIAQGDGERVEYRQGEDLAPYRRAFEQLLPPFRAER